MTVGGVLIQPGLQVAHLLLELSDPRLQLLNLSLQAGAVGTSLYLWRGRIHAPVLRSRQPKGARGLNGYQNPEPVRINRNSRLGKGQRAVCRGGNTAAFITCGPDGDR